MVFLSSVMGVNTSLTSYLLDIQACDEVFNCCLAAEPYICLNLVAADDSVASSSNHILSRA